MSETPKRLKRNLKSKNEHIPCFVHEKCGKSDLQSIQAKVCYGLETTEHTDNNYYCILHLPTKQKNIADFNQTIKSLIKSIDNKISEIESKFPNNEDQQKLEISRLSYDFQYFWFPAKFELKERQFKVTVNFIWATFSSEASFDESNFLAYTLFANVRFLSKVSFRKASFSDLTSFMETRFEAESDFSEVNFLKPVWLVFKTTVFSSTAKFNLTLFSNGTFEDAKFLDRAEFSRCEISGKIDFQNTIFSFPTRFYSAKFLEKSKIEFRATRFCSSVDFSEAEFDGNVNFLNDCFLSADRVKELNNHLKNEKVKPGQEASLTLRNAIFNRPERVSFNSLTLRSSWFVQAEVRNLVFTDVKWLNFEIDIDVDKSGLDTEIDRHENHLYQPNESLMKAFNQLADNSEANRRYEEAKLFRKNSLALKNYSCHVAEGINEWDRENIRRNVCCHDKNIKNPFPVVNEDGGRYYCLWHNPDKNKAEVFLNELEKRINNKHEDYSYVIFPVNISLVNDVPPKLKFHGAKFLRTFYLGEAQITNLDLSETYFGEDSELISNYSKCIGFINLNKTKFNGSLTFSGSNNYSFFEKNGELSMKEAKFDNPNRIAFRSIKVHPHYFVDVDSSKFIFHDCKWTNDNQDKINLIQELNHCTNKELAQTCNQIAINYEETRHFEESAMFRYAAMEAKRLDNTGWQRIFNLFWLYKWTSGYGESWNWALGVLLGLLLLFGILYALPFVNFDYGKEGNLQIYEKEQRNLISRFCEDNFRIQTNYNQMNLCDGIVHSLAVASFQRPDPKPADILTKLLVFLETILAPLQAALLALAIRRKFMR